MMRLAGRREKGDSVEYKSIPSLDPDDSLFLGRLNRYFCEEVESVDGISRADLVWFLRTALLRYEVANDALRERDKRIAELEHEIRGLDLVIDGAEAMLLEMQQECIEANRRCRELEAAEALASLYEHDEELTVFTVLDGEPFLKEVRMTEGGVITEGSYSRTLRTFWDEPGLERQPCISVKRTDDDSGWTEYEICKHVGSSFDGKDYLLKLSLEGMRLLVRLVTAVGVPED